MGQRNRRLCKNIIYYRCAWKIAGHQQKVTKMEHVNVNLKTIPSTQIWVLAALNTLAGLMGRMLVNAIPDTIGLMTTWNV